VSHLSHPHHDPISRKAVQAELIDQTRKSRAMCPGPRPKGEELDAEWVYQDENAATHLIRNAFGAAQAVESPYEVLSLKPPVARLFRDDVTCS
jgi:hypothetical protein